MLYGNSHEQVRPLVTELPSVLEFVCTFGAMAETSWGLVRLGGATAGSMGCMGNEHAEGRKVAARGRKRKTGAAIMDTRGTAVRIGRDCLASRAAICE